MMKKSCFVLFAVIGFLSFLMNVSAGTIYRVDDLKVGTFIESDSKLLVGNSYINDKGKIFKEIDVIFLPDFSDEVNYEKYFVYEVKEDDFVYGTKVYTVKGGSQLDVGNYASVFGTELTEFNGWIVKNIDAFGSNSGIEIVLEPYYFDESGANVLNAYTICKDCDEDYSEFKWYKYEKITETNVVDSTNVSNILDYDGNTLEFTNLNELKNNEAYFTFEFEANKGEFLYFKNKVGLSKKGAARIYYELDGQVIYLNNTIVFEDQYIKITEDGKHKFTIVVEKDEDFTSDDYVILKNVRVLTLINDDNVLAEGKLSGKNEKIMYQAETATGVVLTDTMTYERSEQFLSNMAAESNPDTYSNIIKIVLVTFAISAVVGFIFIRKTRLLK